MADNTGIHPLRSLKSGVSLILAGVALAAPLLLAFNAINNLYGIGSSSMMSRALGLKDQDTVARSSAFGFYCSLICAVLFSGGYTLAAAPLLGVVGADATTF